MRLSIGWGAASLLAAALGWAPSHALPGSAADAAPLSAASIPAGARGLAQRILASADHADLPFAIVDKKAALLLVYLGDGSLVGTTPVLLGRTTGDHSVPGVGERTQSGQLRSTDQTTPAGRFTSEPGYNLTGEAIVWIDYASALAIHRLRAGPSRERRAQHLASPRPQDRRMSAGCVVVPVAFYESVVQPVLGRSRGVVYVMAEGGSTADTSTALESHAF